MLMLYKGVSFLHLLYSDSYPYLSYYFKFQNIINNMFDYQFTSDVFTTMDANKDGQCNKTEFVSQWMHFGSLKALPDFLAVPSKCSFHSFLYFILPYTKMLKLTYSCEKKVKCTTL